MITRALNAEVPEKAISDRANVSEAVLDAHYDSRGQHEKMEQRRKYIDGF